jgi:hypothetical protein
MIRFISANRFCAPDFPPFDGLLSAVRQVPPEAGKQKRRLKHRRAFTLVFTARNASDIKINPKHPLCG